MVLKKHESHASFDPRAPTRLTNMGSITDLLVFERIPVPPPCKKLSKDNYLDIQTGEVKDYKHTHNRAQGYQSVRKTNKNLRELINCNVTDVSKIRWVTLTYKENMTNRERLYSDFEKFWKRLTYFLKKNNIAIPEYITVVEPQGRGAWHIHGLFIWAVKAPFIANDVLAEIWGHGFVSIKQPQNCDNLGAYFSAYLADYPAEEMIALNDKERKKALLAAASSNKGLIEVEKTTDNTINKKIIKGARLSMYPPGMNLYRHSKGIKKPEVIKTTYGEAQKQLSNQVQTYRQVYEIYDDEGNYKNRILKASYNSKRKQKGDAQ